MFTADSSIQALEYDGIKAQIETKSVAAAYKATNFESYNGTEDEPIIDARGLQLDEDLAEKAALVNLNNLGYAKDMYLATETHSLFSRQFYAKQRTIPGSVNASGHRVPEHQGSLDYKFKPSIFNRPRKYPLAAAISAGAAPTLANGASPADAASLFTSADAGTYSYKISAVYADGETLPSTKVDVAVAAGDKVTVEITYAGTPLYFNIFRAPVGTVAGWQFTKRIAVGTSGAAHNIDFNADLPGKADAYLLMHGRDTLAFFQMGGLIKYDLAVTDTSYRWLQLIYGAPVVLQGRKHVLIKNLESNAIA